jgi:hypothetical protein
MRFTVAAFEADAQLLAFGHGRVVSRDADMLALGATFWVQLAARGGWQTGRGLVRSIDEPTDPVYPLVGLVRAHGEGATFDVWVEAFGAELLFCFCFSKREPIFEKCPHLREKGGLLTQLLVRILRGYSE